MKKFIYEAVQEDGATVRGQVWAHSPRAAQRDLAARGMRPTSLEAEGPKPEKRGKTGGVARLDYIYGLKELHALVVGGVPLAEAVSTLADATEHAGLAATYTELNASLRRGEKFSVAFTRLFPLLPHYVHRIIESGELSGRLAEALSDSAEEMEHTAKVRAELRAALLYPAFLVGAGILAVTFVLLFVVPRFAAIFKGKEDKIPFLSYVVISGGMWLRSHLLLCLLAAAAIVTLMVYAFRQPQVRNRFRLLLSRVPLFNHWIIEMETARWAGVLARLLENRVPLLTSLELARSSLTSEDITLRLRQVERGVRAGRSLAATLEENRFLPSTALTLVRVGERSGKLPELMRSVATIYDELVRNRIKALLAIVEPVAIVLIGGAVAFVALAIFTAITSINSLSGLH
jgi:general secretion pathway protein F